MKKVAIHQPQYFPWLGLLHKISQCDLFVFLDNVQFARRSFQNRAVYATQQGPKYLSIPVSASNHQIQQVGINSVHFAEPQEKIRFRHFETLRHRYGRSPGWNLLKSKLETLMSRNYNTVCDMIIDSMVLTMELFEIKVDFIRASSLKAMGRKDELILNITREVGGMTYLSGQGAKAYMREEIFTDAGIAVEYQTFVHPAYKQLHGGYFLEGCMAIDFILDDPDSAFAYAKEALWLK